MLKTHLQILDHKIQAHVSFKVKRKYMDNAAPVCY